MNVSQISHHQLISLQTVFSPDSFISSKRLKFCHSPKVSCLIFPSASTFHRINHFLSLFYISPTSPFVFIHTANVLTHVSSPPIWKCATSSFWIWLIRPVPTPNQLILFYQNDHSKIKNLSYPLNTQIYLVMSNWLQN